MAVAAVAAWHVAHESARRAAAEAVIPAPARLETYSVLTRMPAPHRIAPRVAAELLERWFPDEETPAPSVGLNHRIVQICADRGVAGGAVYDALVALVAREADALLLTRDARAVRTYDRLDVRFRLLA